MTPAYPDTPATVLLADPPWPFRDRLPGKGRGAEKHYTVLAVEAIARFPLPLLADDALLVLWRVAAMPDEALLVGRTWGFRPVSEMVWVKTRLCKQHRDRRVQAADAGLCCPACHSAPFFGMGRTVRACHETALIAVRGRASRVVVDHGVRSVIHAPFRGHSVKPAEVHGAIERLCGPDAVRVELFARRHRPGWACYGDELREVI